MAEFSYQQNSIILHTHQNNIKSAAFLALAINIPDITPNMTIRELDQIAYRPEPLIFRKHSNIDPTLRFALGTELGLDALLLRLNSLRIGNDFDFAWLACIAEKIRTLLQERKILLQRIHCDHSLCCFD